MAASGRSSEIPFLKLCGIRSADEAALAVRMGASAIGLASTRPGGPGFIDEALIAGIVPTIPRNVLSVLLTCEVCPDRVIAQAQRTGVSAVQLCDCGPKQAARWGRDGSGGAYRTLRRALPNVTILQVVHVIDELSVDEILAVGGDPDIDALILDTGGPRRAIRELQGTARIRDWTLSREIARRSVVPVLLAGGLRPDNARVSFEAVQPFGLDVSSGVRTEGHLDQRKVAALVGSLAAETLHVLP